MNQCDKRIEDFKKVAAVIRGAHCVGCVARLCKDLSEAIPDFNWHKEVASLNPTYWTEEFLREFC